MNTSKQTLTSFGLVVLFALFIAAAGYYLFFIRLDESGIGMRGFKGNIIAMEGDTITLHGVFSSPGIIPESFASDRDFTFKINKNSGFKRSDVRWPTWEELAIQGTSGSFNIQDLPRVEGDGSLDDLNNLFLSNPGRPIYVEASFPASIQNSQNPTASSVFYQLMGIPPPLSLLQNE